MTGAMTRSIESEREKGNGILREMWGEERRKKNWYEQKGKREEYGGPRQFLLSFYP
jgi:hypothetical protein